MNMPRKSKGIVVDQEVSSPKNFRWTPPMDDTLLDLLQIEVLKGNRPGGTFTSTAYRNVIAGLHDCQGTNITKKNVQSRMKTLKTNFTLFHGVFNGLSGFSWNNDNKMFEAEEYVWEQRAEVDHKITRLRGKSIPNWDKLFTLWSTSRATGDHSTSLGETSRRLNRGFNFESIGLNDGTYSRNDRISESRCEKQHTLTFDQYAPITPVYSTSHKTRGSNFSGKKRKATKEAMMEDMYQGFADSIRDLSSALISSAVAISNPKNDANRSGKIMSMLQEMSIAEDYLVTCYLYLCKNHVEAAMFIGSIPALRGNVLDGIMRSAGQN